MANSDTAIRPTSSRSEPGVIPVEQALFRRPPGEAPSLLGRSSGFADAWLAEAERLVTGFGDRPAGVGCPEAVFARPLGAKHVAVVQVADLHAAGQSELALGFRLLVLPQAAYVEYLGDPFAVADRFPPAWHDPGPLPALDMPAEPLPPRTVADVQRVLQRVKAHALTEDRDPPTEEEAEERAIAAAESPALLGGVQILVDGGRVVFERPAPDTGLMRGLWTLLPTRTRCELWPASFAFGNALGFDALIVPHAAGEEFAGWTSEDQAAEYPQGQYELNLQIAAEAGDQPALDALLSRRSWKDTWRLGLAILAVFAVVVLLLRFTPSGEERRPRSDRLDRVGLATAVISSHDPLTSVNLLHLGYKWFSKQR